MDAKKEDVQIKDAYTYFVLSETASSLEIQKLHLCFWWYKKSFLKSRRKLLEIGLQIKVQNLERLERKEGGWVLRLDVIVPWLRAKKISADLYDAIRNTKNARFIFNEDVDPGKVFDGGDGATGQVLNFKMPLCVLPVSVTCENGIAHLEIKIPEKYTCSNPIYVRFALLAESGMCYGNNGFSKSLYTYDVKINEPRNLPIGYKQEKICKVSVSYCLHMVPSHYQVSFVTSQAFQNARILEYNRYVDYVSGIPLFKKKIGPNAFQVVFNKSPKDGRHTFFTTFESEHIGMTPIVIAMLVNFMCSLASLCNPFEQQTGLQSKKTESELKILPTTASSDVENKNDEGDEKNDCAAVLR